MTQHATSHVLSHAPSELPLPNNHHTPTVGPCVSCLQTLPRLRRELDCRTFARVTASPDAVVAYTRTLLELCVISMVITQSAATTLLLCALGFEGVV